MIAVLALVALFLGSGVLGLTLSQTFAPQSWVAQVVGLFTLPLAFAVGLQMWYGLALLSLIPRLIAWLRSPGSAVSPRAEAGPVGVPGAFVFLPICSGAGALAGVLIGLLSTTLSLWLVALIYWVIGTAQGVAAWRLGRKGYLLPPEAM